MTHTALDLVDRKRPRLRDVISGNAIGEPELLMPRDTVQTASERMDRTGVSALLVVNDEPALLGIVTSRDIVRHIARSGAKALDWSVERIMTRNVLIDRDTNNCQNTLIRMFEQRFRNMPVYDEDENLLACVETLDVAKAKLAELTETARKLMELLLRQNDERNTVPPEMDLASVLQHMRAYRLDHAVVYDGERCLGYITPDEVLRAVHQAPRAVAASNTTSS